MQVFPFPKEEIVIFIPSSHFLHQPNVAAAEGVAVVVVVVVVVAVVVVAVVVVAVVVAVVCCYSSIKGSRRERLG